jgi:hypothetical protein
MPWSTTVHRPVREVDDRVNGFVTNDGGWLMADGVKEELLDGGKARRRKLIVEGEGLRTGPFLWYRAEKETPKEDERERAHLHGYI